MVMQPNRPASRKCGSEAGRTALRVERRPWALAGPGRGRLKAFAAQDRNESWTAPRISCGRSPPRRGDGEELHETETGQATQGRVSTEAVAPSPSPPDPHARVGRFRGFV